MNDMPPLSNEMALCTNKLYRSGWDSEGSFEIHVDDSTRRKLPGNCRPPGKDRKKPSIRAGQICLSCLL